jgi:D-alanyl-D-alanine carboxypeptidase
LREPIKLSLAVFQEPAMTEHVSSPNSAMPPALGGTKLMRLIFRTTLFIAIVLLISIHLRAQLPPAAAAQIDAAATKALADSGAPSASLAVVKDGQIVYVKAYGNARLEPVTPARAEMRYSIGSVSKQFLAGAILLLVQDGKLSLNDRVARYLPTLTRSSDITIRQLLSHTSGYQDYYPLDYVAPFMLVPVTADDILDRWARKALDFEPGTQWQYSNTNYVVAGRIVERVTGMPLFAFLQSRILGPLGMHSAIDLDAQPLTDADPAGYTRFGLGPARPAPHEGRGWLFAAGELAMTARDLALWDQSLLQGKLLKPASLEEMIKTLRLENGAPLNYALGVRVSNASGHPRLQHGGAVSGFVSSNTVWLDQGAAVVVFTNMDGSSVPRLVTDQVAPLLLAEKQDPQAPQQLAQARRVFSDLQQGKIDQAVLTSDAIAFFTPQLLADAAASLNPLGTPSHFEQTGMGLRGGMTERSFQIRFSSGKPLSLTTFSESDGKFAQYLIQ